MSELEKWFRLSTEDCFDDLNYREQDTKGPRVSDDVIADSKVFDRPPRHQKRMPIDPP